MSEQTTPPTEPTPPARPTRKSFAEQSAGDLLRSLLLLLLIVAAAWGIGSLVSRGEDPRVVRPVDYSGQFRSARDLADYPVLAPRGLGSGWEPTSVDLQSSGGTVRWHLGFLSPRQEYVGLEQADVEPDALAHKYLGGLRPGGAKAVDGRSWQVYSGSTDTALVRRRGDLITIVVGTAPAGVLEEFAASLSPSA